MCVRNLCDVGNQLNRLTTIFAIARAIPWHAGIVHHFNTIAACELRNVPIVAEAYSKPAAVLTRKHTTKVAVIRFVSLGFSLFLPACMPANRARPFAPAAAEIHCRANNFLKWLRIKEYIHLGQNCFQHRASTQHLLALGLRRIRFGSKRLNIYVAHIFFCCSSLR